MVDIDCLKLWAALRKIFDVAYTPDQLKRRRPGEEIAVVMV